jgi:hypothetical protein
MTTWKTRPDGRPDLPRTLAAVDHFRRDPSLVVPRAYRDLWPELLWGACVLFLFDIAVRRIAPDFARMRRTVADQWHKLRGQEVAPPADYMEKLKSRKAEVGEQLDRTRAATRFEPSAEASGAPVDEPLLSGEGGETPQRPVRTQPESGGLAPEPKQEEESYTNRLLRAKQKVWEDREKDKK